MDMNILLKGKGCKPKLRDYKPMENKWEGLCRRSC